MEAEMVRDYALAASGLLVERLGGPSVRPYQPEGVWEAVAMPESNTRVYKTETGDRLYRRSLYTFWKRAAPPADMEIFNAPSVRPYLEREIAPGPDVQSDADLDSYIHRTATTVYHPLGTCRMGNDSVDNAVVDTSLRVKGADRLRVVDASVMPDLVGGNINACVIMIAEKAADAIRGWAPLERAQFSEARLPVGQIAVPPG